MPEFKLYQITGSYGIEFVFFDFFKYQLIMN